MKLKTKDERKSPWNPFTFCVREIIISKTTPSFVSFFQWADTHTHTQRSFWIDLKGKSALRARIKSIILTCPTKGAARGGKGPGNMTFTNAIFFTQKSPRQKSLQGDDCDLKMQCSYCYKIVHWDASLERSTTPDITMQIDLAKWVSEWVRVFLRKV